MKHIFRLFLISQIFACSEKLEIADTTCSILTPKSYSKVVKNNNIHISVSITPDQNTDLKLILYANGEEIKCFETKPYSFDWNTQDFEVGEYTVTALIDDQERSAAKDEIIIEIIPYTPSTFMIDSRDGNIYKTVEIGEQVWMSENLRLENEYARFVSNSSDSLSKYGYLYDTRYGRTQGACPEEWHIPTRDDWDQLIEFLGGESVAGGKLKETGTTIWKHPNTGASNSSGFSAWPAGSLSSGGISQAVGTSARFFTDHYGTYIFLDYDSEGVRKVIYHPSVEFYSIRCIRDY